MSCCGFVSFSRAVNPTFSSVLLPTPLAPVTAMMRPSGAPTAVSTKSASARVATSLPVKHPPAISADDAHPAVCADTARIAWALFHSWRQAGTLRTTPTLASRRRADSMSTSSTGCSTSNRAGTFRPAFQSLIRCADTAHPCTGPPLDLRFAESANDRSERQPEATYKALNSSANSSRADPALCTADRIGPPLAIRDPSEPLFPSRPVGRTRPLQRAYIDLDAPRVRQVPLMDKVSRRSRLVGSTGMRGLPAA
ncbi:hypothetical protein SAMN05444423_10392 [Nocardia asteroides]|nr:hypothetical protein SAMN05444423_10392 [Nocardia asteroides]